MYNQGAWALTDIGPNHPGIRVDSLPLSYRKPLDRGRGGASFSTSYRAYGFVLYAGGAAWVPCLPDLFSFILFANSFTVRAAQTNLISRCGEPPCPDR